MLFDDTYLTIAAPAEGQFRDRGSRFIAYAYPVSSEEEFRTALAALKKEEFGANHHCWAFRIGPDKQFFRSNDDGEPSGTAGRPILGQIQSHDLTNIGIIVVRYFGGTLLGVSGLINAYKTAAAEAIAQAQIVERQVREVYAIQFAYEAMNEVMRILKDHELEQWGQDFQLDCKLEFAVRKSVADDVCAALKKITTLTLKYVRTI